MAHGGEHSWRTSGYESHISDVVGKTGSLVLPWWLLHIFQIFDAPKKACFWCVISRSRCKSSWDSLKFGEKASLCKDSQADRRKESFVLPLGAGCTGLQAAHEGGTSMEQRLVRNFKKCFLMSLTPTHSEIIYFRSKSCQIFVLRVDSAHLWKEKQLNLKRFHSGSFRVRSRNIHPSALCLFAIVSPLS